MRLGIQAPYAGDFQQVADEVKDLETAGLDIVSVAEVYTFDAVSQLGFLAARTERVEIMSAILPIYSRTPALTAMTAAGLDFVSGGRFILGLGASGPQVVEGWHGVPYDRPLQRTREIIEICRTVWRRERLSYDGTAYTLPLPADQGTGLGKPLKLINTPLRERIPVSLAAIGPRNVELAAETAEMWQPILFHPGRASEVWGESLAAGSARRDAALGTLEIATALPVLITEDEDQASVMLDAVRPFVALYVGGMGAKGRNFYNDLTRRYGFEAEAERVQDLYLAGDKEAAAAAVPAELVRETSLIGPRGWVSEQVAALREAGVTALLLQPIDDTPEGRRRTVEDMRAIVDA